MGAPEFTHEPLTLEEILKIVSLLWNPPEAKGLRFLLQYYKVPDNIDWDSIPGANIFIQGLGHYTFPQSDYEFGEFLDVISGAKSYLEVGSNFGGSLSKVAEAMPEDSLIVSVDLPCDDTPKWLNPLHTLKTMCKRIGNSGRRMELFIGDSHSPKVVEAVAAYAPFDAVFIDGDHSTEGMVADWHNYGPMGRIVGFHDIVCVPDVKKGWEVVKKEAKAAGYRYEEIVSMKDPIYGIGVVYRE